MADSALSFEKTYPYLSRWVKEYGWLEIGPDSYSRSLVRAIDEGGMVWEGQTHYATIDEALAAMEEGLGEWMKAQGLADDE